MKINYVMPLLLLMLAIIVSGCISLEADDNVQRDGSSQITMKIDMTQLRTFVLAMNSSAKSSDFDMEMERQGCANLTASIAQDTRIAECKVTDGVLYVKGTKAAGAPNVTFTKEEAFPYTTYYYSPSQMTALPGTINATSVAQLKALNAKLTYAITMPGEVYETSGKIENGKAVFDLLDTALSEKTMYAKSRELNAALLLPAILVPLLVIIAVIIFLRRRR